MKSDLLRRTMRRFEGDILGIFFLVPIGAAVYFLAEGGYGILTGDIERGQVFVGIGLLLLVVAIVCIRFAWRRLRELQVRKLQGEKE